MNYIVLCVYYMTTYLSILWSRIIDSKIYYKIYRGGVKVSSISACTLSLFLTQSFYHFLPALSATLNPLCSITSTLALVITPNTPSTPSCTSFDLLPKSHVQSVLPKYANPPILPPATVIPTWKENGKRARLNQKGLRQDDPTLL